MPDLIRDAADTDVLLGLMVAATVAGLVRGLPLFDGLL